MTHVLNHDIWIVYLKVKVMVRIQIFQTIAVHVFSILLSFLYIYKKIFLLHVQEFCHCCETACVVTGWAH